MNRYAEWDAIAQSNSRALDELIAARKFFVAAGKDSIVRNAPEEGMPRLGRDELEGAALWPRNDYCAGELGADYARL